MLLWPALASVSRPGPTPGSSAWPLVATRTSSSRSSGRTATGVPIPPSSAPRSSIPSSRNSGNGRTIFTLLKRRSQLLLPQPHRRPLHLPPPPSPPPPAAGRPASRPTPMFRLARYRDFDWVLLGFVGLLSLISVLEIKSATLHTKFHGFETKQIEFLLTGLVLMFLISLIDYHRLLDIVHYAYGISILSLIAVLAVGTKVLGARRWIKVPGGHFQPSEWIKLVLIVAVARSFWGL